MYKGPGKKIHQSMRGTVVDMEAMRASNERSVAIGNARMNTRGDIVGLGGKIVARREQLVQAYYKDNPNGVKHMSIKDVFADDFMSPAQALENLSKQTTDTGLDMPSGVAGKKAARKLVDKED